jgi:hypothetical protein
MSTSALTLAANALRTRPVDFGGFFPVMVKEYFTSRPLYGLHKPENGFSILGMETSLYEFVLQQLEQAKGKWPSVASGSGVPKRTIEKIARQETKNPGIKHVEKLAEYFREAA